MIKVYTKPNCMQCNFTKQFLGDNHVTYQAIDVSLDEEAMEHVRELGYSSLPVIELDSGETWHGFQPDRLEGLLER